MRTQVEIWRLREIFERKRKLKELGEGIEEVKSKTLETLYTRRRKKPRVNANIETNIEELPLLPPNLGARV